MKIIDKTILDNLCQEALASSRKRKNLNYHEELSDTLQRLLNAMQSGTYIQPHKHENPDKREVFIILQGKLLLVCYNDTGEITNHIILDSTTGNYGAEIPAKTWHSIIILKPNTVVFEVKDGPYEPINDKNFAAWAPKEGDKECENYNRKILEKLGINSE
jgi:cupin fold WbuC family metalloprotein